MGQNRSATDRINDIIDLSDEANFLIDRLAVSKPIFDKFVAENPTVRSNSFLYGYGSFDQAMYRNVLINVHEEKDIDIWVIVMHSEQTGRILTEEDLYIEYKMAKTPMGKIIYGTSK